MPSYEVQILVCQCSIILILLKLIFFFRSIDTYILVLMKHQQKNVHSRFKNDSALLFQLNLGWSVNKGIKENKCIKEQLHLSFVFLVLHSLQESCSLRISAICF